MKSFLFPQFQSNPLSGNTIKLPKLGNVTINLHRPIPDGFKIKQVRIIRKAVGWFATISISADLDVPQVGCHGRALGGDIGLLDYLATSDGFRLPNPKFLKTLQSKLKLLQRRLSRKKKRSKNYEKARKKVERLHNHICFVRKDFQYKLAHKLCDMGDSIFVEDIDFRISAKGMFSKQMLDGGFGQFRSILEWVCWKRGKFFAKVDARGTSKQCPNCQEEWDNNLSIRWHECGCGYANNRDVAAAEVIRNRGIEQHVPVDSGEWKQPATGLVSEKERSAGDENLGKCDAGIPNREVRKPILTKAPV